MSPGVFSGHTLRKTLKSSTYKSVGVEILIPATMKITFLECDMV
jgi:hypothetical protein